MILGKIIDRIKEKLARPDKKEWLTRLVQELENHRFNFDTLPFNIVETKDTGFLVKVNGLFAFVSFYHMPWKYVDTGCWIAIAPKLTGKRFFCKIHKIDKEPLFVIINGAVPQFKKAEPTTGKEYKGLVIKITDYGIFIDIGYHFDWKYGSLVGLLHKSQIGVHEKIENFFAGQEVTTIFQGVNDRGQYVLSNDRETTDWQLGIPQSLVGLAVWAIVERKPGHKATGLLVRGKYKSQLAVNKQYYAKYRKTIK